MWNQDDLKLPKDWTIYQQITIIDMSTFELYVKNMKSLLNAMVKNSELIICNRCDGIEDLDRYKRMLKSMNTKCDIVFEDENGEIDEISEEDLPYDMKADVIKISPEAYGIWYIDCMDKPERYKGKVVEFYRYGHEIPQTSRKKLLCSGTYGHDLLRGGYDLPGLYL